MSELLLTENEKRCWNKAYPKHVSPLSEIREGWGKKTPICTRDTLLCFSIPLPVQSHTHACYRKRAKWNAWLER